MWIHRSRVRAPSSVFARGRYARGFRISGENIHEPRPTPSVKGATRSIARRHAGPSGHDRCRSRCLRTLRIRTADHAGSRVSRCALRFRRKGYPGIHLHCSEPGGGAAWLEVRSHRAARSRHRAVQGFAKTVSPIHRRAGLARGQTGARPVSRVRAIRHRRGRRPVGDGRHGDHWWYLRQP